MSVYRPLKLARMKRKTVSFETPYKVYKENPKYPRMSRWVWNAAVKLGILKPYIDQDSFMVDDVRPDMQKTIVNEALGQIESAIERGAKRDRLCIIVGLKTFDEILDTDFAKQGYMFEFDGEYGFNDNPKSDDPFGPPRYFSNGRFYGIKVKVFPWITGLAVIEV